MQLWRFLTLAPCLCYNAGMDVERLRIPHAPSPPTGPPTWGRVVVTALLCVVVGFVLGRATARRQSPPALPVASAVAQPAEQTSAAQFMASGWIEVPAPRYPIVLTARVTERLAALYVHEGQMVTSGMVVAQLYDQDLRKQCDAARATFLAASNRAARIESGYRDEDVSAALASLREAEERLRSTSARFERVQAMLRAQVVSTDEYDTVYSIYRQAQATYEYAEAQWRKRAAGYRPEEVAQARAEAAAAEAAWHLAERAVEHCIVRVPPHPRPLRVLSVPRSVGEWITAGDDGDPTLVTLYDPHDLYVRVDVNQANISSVQTSMPVLITTEAAGRRRYRGTVVRIEPRANLAKNTITVRVAIDDPDELLFPDMLCQVTFLESGAAPVPHQATHVAACPDAACQDTACQDSSSNHSTHDPAECFDPDCQDDACLNAFMLETSDATPPRVQDHALYVPAAALVTNGSGVSVWVIERGRARLQPVSIAGGDGSLVEVRDGVQAGQRVIVQPPPTLAAGQRVEVR